MRAWTLCLCHFWGNFILNKRIFNLQIRPLNSKIRNFNARVIGPLLGTSRCLDDVLDFPALAWMMIDVKHEKSICAVYSELRRKAAKKCKTVDICLFRLAVSLVHPFWRRPLLLQVPGGRGPGMQGVHERQRVRNQRTPYRSIQARSKHLGGTGKTYEINK
jgi:hypothetical protein